MNKTNNKQMQQLLQKGISIGKAADALGESGCKEACDKTFKKVLFRSKQSYQQQISKKYKQTITKKGLCPDVRLQQRGLRRLRRKLLQYIYIYIYIYIIMCMYV